MCSVRACHTQCDARTVEHEFVLIIEWTDFIFHDLLFKQTGVLHSEGNLHNLKSWSNLIKKKKKKKKKKNHLYHYL